MRTLLVTFGFLSIASSLACSGAPTDELAPAPIGSVSEAQGGGGTGGGGGGNSFQITTVGLYLVDAPVAGEASIDGTVSVWGSGHTVAPADTVVAINGVALAPVSGPWPLVFRVSPTGAQPALGADGFLHVVATSASAKQSRTLNLACPARVGVTSTPAVGASLGGSSSVTLSFASQLPQNAPSVINFFTGPSALLREFDATTGAIGAGVSFTQLTQASMSATLTTFASATGYRAELRFPGIYLLDGNSGGVCGRAERFNYAH